MNTEDFDAAKEVITAEVEDEEHIIFDVNRFATLEWDEDPAPGRPEMTGQWRLHYRDGTSEEIDLPQANIKGATQEAVERIARKLTTP